MLPLGVILFVLLRQELKKYRHHGTSDNTGSKYVELSGHINIIQLTQVIMIVHIGYQFQGSANFFCHVFCYTGAYTFTSLLFSFSPSLRGTLEVKCK